MTKEDIVALAKVGVDRSADRIERVYGWRVERVLTTMRATFVVAGSIVGTWLAAVFAGAGRVGMWQVGIAAAGLAGSFAGVIYQTAALDRLYVEYLEGLRALRVVERGRVGDEWIHSQSS